jgi:hypothetical protein
MFKKIIRDIIIVFCFCALWASTSRYAMKYITDKRDFDTWWGLGQLNHGDLASMSHLDYLPNFYSPETNNLKRAKDIGSKNTVVFLHGDSYTWKLGDSVFAGICQYQFVGWNSPFKYHLDSTKRNILIIESAERLVREYFSSTKIIEELSDTILDNRYPKLSSISFRPKIFCGFLSAINADLFFNKYINQNLACNLFNYNFMAPLFGLKASINYFLFSRASGDVTISNNKQYLFYRQTLSPEGTSSSFSPLPQQQTDRIVDNLNAIYDYYKRSGFDEVYLSIIPSTVTVIQPAGYNNLIPSIQNHSRLKMPVIDVYSVFKLNDQDYFLHGDTHWSIEGKQKWIDMVNDRLVNDRKSL